VAEVYAKLGGNLHEDNNMPMGQHRVVLGNYIDLARACEEGVMAMDVTEAFRANTRSFIEGILDRNECLPSEASKVRGCMAWASCAERGKVGRLAVAPLARRQYFEEEKSLNPRLEMALAHCWRLLSSVPACVLLLLPRKHENIIIYSDASWEPDRSPPGKIGWLIFHPCGRVVGRALDISADMVALCNERASQIQFCEGFPGLAVPHFHPELADASILWFVDNEGAVSNLVRCVAASEDMLKMVSRAHELWLDRNLWVEWIASASNLSDGISRDGVTDALSIALYSDLAEIPQCEIWTLIASLFK
jgi:hypothetical protein